MSTMAPVTRQTVSLEQAAGGRPIIKLHDETIRAFIVETPTQSVWTSLYTWLVSNETAEPESLHNRTRVGDQLMNRLLKAEAIRIRKQYQLIGQDLRKALGWSNMNSGPMTTFEGSGAHIIGDGMYVVGLFIN